MRRRRLLLCAVLALLVSTHPAAAAATPPNGVSVTITADTRIPIIDVSVPDSADVIINPYEMPVDIGTGQKNYGQIISTPSCLSNYSDVAIQMDLAVTAHVREAGTQKRMTLASSPTGGGGTQKRAFIYLEFQQTDTGRFKDVQWDSAYSASKPTHIVLRDGVTVIRNNLMKLPPVTSPGKVAPGGYAPFRLTGDAVASPTDEWTTDDGIDVRITFTFKPLPYDQW